MKHYTVRGIKGPQEYLVYWVNTVPANEAGLSNSIVSDENDLEDVVILHPSAAVYKRCCVCMLFVCVCVCVCVCVFRREI